MANKPKRPQTLYSDFANPANAVIPPPRQAADLAGAPAPDSPGDNSDLDIRTPYKPPVGVLLTAGELAALDSLAESYSVSRHGLLKIAVRLFILGVRSGQINPADYLDTPPQPRKRVRLPRG